MGAIGITATRVDVASMITVSSQQTKCVVDAMVEWCALIMKRPRTLKGMTAPGTSTIYNTVATTWTQMASAQRSCAAPVVVGRDIKELNYAKKIKTMMTEHATSLISLV